MKHENTAIEVKDKDHGRRIIQWWRDQGVFTSVYNGNSVGWSYGLYKGKFTLFSPQEVVDLNLKTIEI